MGFAKRWVVLFLPLALGLAPGVASAQKQRIDFEETGIDGEMRRPAGEYILERRRPRFQCDITKLTLEEYNSCFESELARSCGLQVIERERFELKFVGKTTVSLDSLRTIGSAYPYSIHLGARGVFALEASRYDEWRENLWVLQNQTPPLSRVDVFTRTADSLVFGDKRTQRIFVVSTNSLEEGVPKFRRIDISGAKHSLLGVVSSDRFFTRTSGEVLLMQMNARGGVRVNVPADDYEVDPYAARSGDMLLVSRSRTGKVYLVNSSGGVRGSFDREPGYVYHLLPRGLVASADLGRGIIKIRSHTGVVVSRTALGRTLLQFGVFRRGRDADLFYVSMDGLGVLYGDGFEKSFLSRDGVRLRVVEAEDGVLGVAVNVPTRDDPRITREGWLEFYKLGETPTRISKVVQGVCPSAIKAAETALELTSSRKGSMKDGRFEVYR